MSTQNIFVVSTSPNWWVKIGDFGISKRTEEGRTDLRSFTGTPGFLAPEVLGHIDADADENSSAYTHAVDIWSAGETTFRILAGEAPFGSMSALGLYTRGLMTFPTSVLLVRGLSQSACDFVKNLMAPRARDRMTAEEALAHVWLKSGNPAEDTSPTVASSPRVVEHLTLDTDEEQDPPPADPKPLAAENNPFSVASGSWSTFAEGPAENVKSILLPEVPSEDISKLDLPASSEEIIQAGAGQNEPKTVSGGLAPGSLSRNWSNLLHNSTYENFGNYNCPFAGCLFSKGTAFDTSEALVQHISKSHGRINRPPYHCVANNCPLVGAIFQSPEELATHLQTAHRRDSRTHLCPVKGCEFAQGSGFAGGTALSMHLQDAHNVVSHAAPTPATMDLADMDSITFVLVEIIEAINRIRPYMKDVYRVEKDRAEYLQKLDTLASVLRAVERRQDDIRSRRPWDKSLEDLYPSSNPESPLSQLAQIMKDTGARLASNRPPWIRFGPHLEKGAVGAMFEQIERTCDKIRLILGLDTFILRSYD